MQLKRLSRVLRWEYISTRINVTVSIYSWDYLEIHDGWENSSASVGRFCGYKPLRFLSESNKVYLYFVSDGFFQDKGFRLTFKTVPKGKKHERQYCNPQVLGEGTPPPHIPELFFHDWFFKAYVDVCRDIKLLFMSLMYVTLTI